jgi:c-di-GMP-binding flagellar brake protein YcgR
VRSEKVDFKLPEENRAMPSEVGYIERRQFVRVPAKTEVRFREIDGKEADTLIRTNTYKDITTLAPPRAGDPLQVKDIMTVVTENVSAGGLKLVADKPFILGKSLSIELVLPAMPLPIKAVALVMYADSGKNPEGKYTAGLRFIGISREDVARVDRFINLRKQH